MAHNPRPSDTFALAIAKEFRFDCYIRGTGRYSLTPANEKDPRLDRCAATQTKRGFLGQALPNDWTLNPCAEIPGQFTIYLGIEDTTVTVHNHFKYDLNDPKLLDYLTAHFSDIVELDAQVSRVRAREFAARLASV